MTKRPDILVCPKCGMDMVCHAEKPVAPDGRDEALEMDAHLELIVLEVHLCLNCGNIASRRTVPV